MKRFWSTLFPPARRAWRWLDTWPLVLVSVALVVSWLVLEAAQWLLLARPLGLLVFLLAPWVWWLHTTGYAGLSRGRGQAAVLVRLLLLALFALMLAEPRAVRTRDTVSVMFALDVSDSVRQTDAAMEYIVQTVYQHQPRGGKDEVGLLVFGRNAAVELPPRMNLRLDEGLTLTTQIDRGATNLQEPLELASALFADDVQGRVVLISDGVETEGNVRRAIDQLAAKGIAVDVLPIDYAYEREVWLERLDLPTVVKPGETYDAAVVVNSLQPGRGELVISQKGEVLARQTVNFAAGKNRFSIPITLPNAGYYEYSAVLEPEAGTDTLAQNNRVLNYVFVEGEGRTLLVVDSLGDERDTAALAQALRESKRSVDIVTAEEFPRDAASLLPHDLVIFVNVAQDLFDGQQQRALKEAVGGLGCGFLMVGGQNSFGAGGWQNTPVEEILPVTMDVSNKKVLPKGALVIVLHSCEFAAGNTWGKRITKEAIRILSAQDEVGVLVYEPSNGVEWLFELTPAGQYDELVPKINGATIGDMPSFNDTMALGLEGLMKSDASARHMIIISDGDPGAPTEENLQAYVDNKITVSTVSIFPHGGTEISLMRAIAEVTGGRYYAVNDDPNRLPGIFIKEAKTLRRNLLQERVFAPQIGFPSPLLKGLGALPELRGYVLTSARDRSTTVLQAPPQPSDPSQLDPILSTWQFQLGRTGAFTSDLSPRWGAQWQSWEHFQAFVNQLAIDLARVRSPSQMRVSSYTNGGQGVVIVEDFGQGDTFLDLQGKVIGPEEKSEALAFRQVAPRRYQAQVPLWGHGRYHVNVAGRGSNADGTPRDERLFGGFIVPYSPEYLRLQSDRGTLNEIAERTRGRLLTGRPEEDNLFQVDRRPRQSSRPIFDWFLWALAILIPLDVGIRRIQIDWSVVRRWLSLRRSGPSTETMSTLLQRKQAVQDALTQRETGPLEPPPSPARSRPRPASSGASSIAGRVPAETSPAPPAPSAGGSPAGSNPTNPGAGTGSAGGASTMEQLLALKRKRGQPPGSGQAPPPPAPGGAE